MTMQSRKLWIFTLLIPIFYLWVSFPYFEAYLHIPNRHLLPWDPAIHSKDGMLFFLQLKRLDLISFLYTLISLTFWMPLHPLLLAGVSVFFPFHYDAYVYVNFISIPVGLGWFSYLVLRSSIFANAQKPLLTLGALYLVLRMQNTPIFWTTHLSVMIESLAVGLTCVFALSSLLEEYESDRHFYLRTSMISLSLLLFTKVQYGLFFGAAYVLKHLYLERKILFGKNGVFAQFFRALLKKKIFVGVLIAFLAFGCFALFTFNRFSDRGFGVPDGVWAIGFIFILIATWIVRSKNSQVIEARSSSPDFLKEFCRWILLPFGWYYLMPFRHKIRSLLYNAGTQSTESISQKLTDLFSDTAQYLNLSVQGAFTLIALTLGLGLFLVVRRKIRGSSFFYGVGLLVLFYLPMSLFAGARMARTSITWVVVLGILALVWSAFALIQKRVATWIVCAALAIGCVYEQTHFQIETATSTLQEHNFLHEDHQSIGLALKSFDFSKPGIIYGLGNTMDLATILFDLEILKTHPEYSSVFSKREDRDLVSNDFGRKGNQNPVQVILDRAANPKVGQILLYRSGFQSGILEDLTRKLILAPFNFRVSISNSSFLMLKKP